MNHHEGWICDNSTKLCGKEGMVMIASMLVHGIMHPLHSLHVHLVDLCAGQSNAECIGRQACSELQGASCDTGEEGRCSIDSRIADNQVEHKTSFHVAAFKEIHFPPSQQQSRTALSTAMQIFCSKTHLTVVEMAYRESWNILNLKRTILKY